MLEARDVDVTFGPVRAVRGVSLRVEPGELVAVLGANGAGKTSLLRALAGLEPVAGGSVHLDGVRVDGASAERRARGGIALIPQGRGIFGGMTVGQNLRLGGYASRLARPAFVARAADVLQSFPRLAQRLSQTAGTLSGGEQQMLAIARAMIAKPRYLLVDEPSDGLAPKLVDEVFALLDRARADGTAVLVVEQRVAVALDHADRGYVLERGRIVRAGDAIALRGDRSVLESAYLGAAR